MPLTPTEKGAIAEAAITATALRAGVVVLRPVVEGRRYDLVFDFGDRIERVQCKWGRLVDDDVIVVRTGTCRHTPTRGYVRTVYTAGEVDALAVWCEALGRCYYLPASEVVGKADLHLRLQRPRNDQRSGVTLAAQYEFGAVAQLGER